MWQWRHGYNIGTDQAREGETLGLSRSLGFPVTCPGATAGGPTPQPWGRCWGPNPTAIFWDCPWVTGAIPAGGEFPSAWGTPKLTAAWCEGRKASLLTSRQGKLWHSLHSRAPPSQAEATSHPKPHAPLPSFLPLHPRAYSEHSVLSQQMCSPDPTPAPASKVSDPRCRSRAKFLEEEGEEHGNDCCGERTGKVPIPLTPSRRVLSATEDDSSPGLGLTSPTTQGLLPISLARAECKACLLPSVFSCFLLTNPVLIRVETCSHL